MVEYLSKVKTNSGLVSFICSILAILVEMLSLFLAFASIIVDIGFYLSMTLAAIAILSGIYGIARFLLTRKGGIGLCLTGILITVIYLVKLWQIMSIQQD